MMCPRSIFLVADGCRTGGSRPDRFSTISGSTGRVDLFHRFFGQHAQHAVTHLNSHRDARTTLSAPVSPFPQYVSQLIGFS
jgi:hypothetical protein